MLKDKFLRWLTYKLLYYRLIKDAASNCCGALYTDESGKSDVAFEVRTKGPDMKPTFEQVELPREQFIVRPRVATVCVSADELAERVVSDGFHTANLRRADDMLLDGLKPFIEHRVYPDHALGGLKYEATISLAERI